MRRNKVSGILVLLSFCMIISGVLVSCEYEFAEFEEVDPGQPVSFAADIEPIFNSGNNCTSCHRTGSTAPDLTTGNAYQAIVPGLINTDNPEASQIYSVPHPSSAGHGFRKYTQLQAGRVLSWIKQGAADN